MENIGFKRKRTSNGREPRIVPPLDEPLVYEPVQLALGEERIDEVKSAVSERIRLACVE